MDDETSISANWNNDKEKWYMPHLEIKEIGFTIDNDEYLFNQFYENLLNYADSRKRPIEQFFKEEYSDSEYESFFKWINKERANDIIELIESAKELDWDKL